MQSGDAIVSPPITASTSSMPQVAVGDRGGDESSNPGNKAGDRVLASLWIRRLKPRKEPNSLKGETFVPDNETLHAGNSDPSSSTHPVGIHLDEVSAMKTWANKPFSKIRKLDGEKAVLQDALNEQISSSEQQNDGGERKQNRFKQGQGRLVQLATGFDQQINQIEDAKSERISPTKSMTVDKNVNSRCTSEAAMVSHTCSQTAESKSQFMHAGRVQAAEGGILTSSLGKPPLPPSHNKAGLPPRPAGHKSSSFSARAAGKISSSPTNKKLAAIPSQGIARHLSHIAAMKESLLANKASTGPLLKEGHQAKEDGTGCQAPLSKENGMSIEVRRVLPCTGVDKPMSVAQKVVPSVEPGMQQLAVPNSKESLKNPNRFETSAQASSTLLKEAKTPSECSVVSSQADETVGAPPSTSTTASFPWEMFAGAAGPSRSAREEFVEVYNRARNELKNQKFSSSITKVFYKGMENRPGHARSIPDTSIVEREGQASDQQQQQPEISEKLSKVDGVDCVSQHGGVRVTGTNGRLSQKELFSEKHNCESFLEVAYAGDVDINPGKKSQAFQNVHVACGKEIGSFMQGQCNGPLHGCVELPAVGQKGCSSTSEKSLHCRQGFASSSMPEGAASIHGVLFQPTHVDKTDVLSHDNNRRQPGMSDNSLSSKKTLMLLSKRQLGMFDRSPRVITGKESIQRITLPRKSDVWLQRWYAPYITRSKGSQEHKLPESNMCQQTNESDEHAACMKDLRKGLIEKDVFYRRIIAEPKQLKASPEKVLPTAAAMAIVGTAARQFCTMQDQHKNSFAFWSGFRMLAPQIPDHFTDKEKTPEHFTETGKRKLTFKADPTRP